jgi:hypothetical protein
MQNRRRRARSRRRPTTHPMTIPAIGPAPSLDLDLEEEEEVEEESLSEGEVGVGVTVTVVPVGPGVVMVTWLGKEVVLGVLDEGTPEMASTWVLWEMKRGVAGMTMERAARGASRASGEANLWPSIPLAALRCWEEDAPSTLKSGL